MEKIRVLIIGAGKIASGFDSTDINDESIFTHAKAVKLHHGLELVGFVDVNDKVLQESCKKWNVKGYTSIEKAFEECSIDIVVIAVPDKWHYKIMKALINFPIKLIFTEKPFTETLTQSYELIDLYKNLCPIAINYTRRYSEGFKTIRERIKKNEFGRFLLGTGYYGKGFKHNGSHMVDLLYYFFDSVRVISKFNSVNDYSDMDLTYSLILEVNGKNFVMHGLSQQFYTVFEMELYFERGKINIKNSGFDIEVYGVEKSEQFIGYGYLKSKEIINTFLNKAMYNAYVNIYDYLTKKTPLICTAKESIKLLELANNCEKK